MAENMDCSSMLELQHDDSCTKIAFLLLDVQVLITRCILLLLLDNCLCTHPSISHVASLMWLSFSMLLYCVLLLGACR
jgi:hypothetical protein